MDCDGVLHGVSGECRACHHDPCALCDMCVGSLYYTNYLHELEASCVYGCAQGCTFGLSNLVKPDGPQKA